jgi:hypothetical protein
VQMAAYQIEMLLGYHQLTFYCCFDEQCALLAV